MLVVTGIGRATADPEVKTSPNGNQYARFNIAVNKGFGDGVKTIFLQCWLHGEKQVQRLVKAGVKKGSQISFTGDLDIEEYEKKDKTKEKIAKITIYDWSYVTSAAKANGETAPVNGANSVQPQSETANGYDEMDISDDDLPM